MLCYEFEIDKLWQTIVYGKGGKGDKSADVGYIKSNLCGHSWAVDIKSDYYLCSFKGYPRMVYCPYCGKLHHLTVETTSEDLWINANFKLYKHQKCVKLVITGKKVEPMHRALSCTETRYKEVFEFNTQTRQALWHCHTPGCGIEPYTVELLPWNYMQIFKGSVLASLYPRDRLPQAVRSNLISIMRMLRTELEKSFKFKISPTFIGGELLAKIINCGFRFKFPDFENLNNKMSFYYSAYEAIYDKYLTPLTRAEKRISSIDVLLGRAELPTTKTFRKWLKDHPTKLHTLESMYRSCGEDEQLTATALKRGADIWPAATLGITALGFTMDEVKRFYWNQLQESTYDHIRFNDILRQAEDLASYLRTEDIKSEVEPKLNKTFHDWLSCELYQHRNKLITFKYTNKQLNLVAKYNDIEFALPKNNIDLFMAGKKLKNCVASYGSKVANGKCTIVLMYKAKKLVACIELEKNAVRQAKVFANTQISKVEELNWTLQLWAKDKIINYKSCKDVAELRKAV